MYSNDLKLRAIKLYEKFKSYRSVGNILLIGKSTLHRWVTEHNKNLKENKILCVENSNISNNMSNNNTTNNNNNTNTLHITIEKYLRKNKFITIKNIQIKLFKIFKKKFTLSSIYKIIKYELKYSYKRINKKVFNNSIKKLKKQQKIFEQDMKKINTDNIICIDETYIYSNYCSNYGWAKIGEPLISYVKSNPIKYSIIMAISKKKIISYKIIKGNVNGEIYYDYIKELNNLYANSYFLMDNVNFHKSKKLQALFSESTNKILYIPPYSPQYNPIEEVFAQIKSYIKQCDKHNVINKFIKGIKQVKSIHLVNYYKHAFNNIYN
jgi:transposase